MTEGLMTPRVVAHRFCHSFYNSFKMSFPGRFPTEMHITWTDRLASIPRQALIVAIEIPRTKWSSVKNRFYNGLSSNFRIRKPSAYHRGILDYWFVVIQSCPSRNLAKPLNVRRQDPRKLLRDDSEYTMVRPSYFASLRCWQQSCCVVFLNYSQSHLAGSSHSPRNTKEVSQRTSFLITFCLEIIMAQNLGSAQNPFSVQSSRQASPEAYLQTQQAAQARLARSTSFGVLWKYTSSQQPQRAISRTPTYYWIHK